MTADNEHDLDLTAAEYALGTLAADQARRFVDRLAHDRAARRALAQWEERLARLAADLEPVAPPPEVWQRIIQRVESASNEVEAGAHDLLGHVPAMVSMIHDEATGSAWLLTAEHGDAPALTVDTMRDYPVPHGKQLRLWVEVDGLAAPAGALPPTVGRRGLTLTPQARAAMTDHARFMVSLEDDRPGVTEPSGPVLWTAPVGRRAV